MFALQYLSEGGEGPNTELLWVLYIGIAFFLLVIALGWLAGSRKQEPVAAEPEAIKPKSRKKEADDLAKIEGIGPKVAKVLRSAGISTFEDLAKARAADVQKLLNESGMQMMKPEGWIEQARAAAKGDWKAFEKLQNEMKGGRRK